MFFFFFFGGTKLRTKCFADTHFQCPNCRVARPAKRCRAANWLHLYWIPLVRLKSLGEVIVCGTCQGVFDAEGKTLAGDSPATGATWRCAVCGNVNPRSASSCLRCGGAA